MATGYSSGMRKHRVEIWNRQEAQTGKFGLDASGIGWQKVATVWAAVDFAKGMRSLNAGAIDAYGVILVRMDWNSHITMRSRIREDGQTYQILPETFHSDRQQNIIQFNAQAVLEDATPQPSSSDI